MTEIACRLLARSSSWSTRQAATSARLILLILPVLADVLLDCQAPLDAGEPTGDLRQDLISAVRVFVDPLQSSKLGEVLVAAMDRAPTDSRIEAMHDAMTAISRRPVWDIAQAAIEQGRLDPTLTEEAVAAHTIGPILYARLFDRQEITEDRIERTIDAFLAAFAPGGRARSQNR